MIGRCSGGSRISPRRGANSPGRGGAPTYDFAKNSQKLHEIEIIWAPGGGVGGGARPKFYYVDPPLRWTSLLWMLLSLSGFGFLTARKYCITIPSIVCEIDLYFVTKIPGNGKQSGTDRRFSVGGRDVILSKKKNEKIERNA